MKYSRITVLLCLVVCTTLPAGWAESVSPAEALQAAVLRCDEARADATVTANTLALEDQLTDDCLYAHSNGRVHTKKEFIAALANGDIHYDVMRHLGRPTVRLYGGETAILTGRAHVEATSRARGAVSLDIIYTAVYVLREAQWKLASYQSTVAPK